MCKRRQILYKCSRCGQRSRENGSKTEFCLSSRCSTIKLQLKPEVMETRGSCDNCGPRPGYEDHRSGGNANGGTTVRIRTSPRRGVRRLIPTSVEVGGFNRLQGIADDGAGHNGNAHSHANSVYLDAQRADIRQEIRQLDRERTAMETQYHEAIVGNAAVLEKLTKEVVDMNDVKERIWKQVAGVQASLDTLMAVQGGVLRENERIEAGARREKESLAELRNTRGRLEREVENLRHTRDHEQRHGRRSPSPSPRGAYRRAPAFHDSPVIFRDGRLPVSESYIRQRRSSIRRERRPAEDRSHRQDRPHQGRTIHVRIRSPGCDRY